MCLLPNAAQRSADAPRAVVRRINPADKVLRVRERPESRSVSPELPGAGGGRSGVLLPQKYHPFRKPPRNLRCATDGVVVHNENFRTDTLLSQRRFDRLRQEGFAASHRDHNACQTGYHTHHRISAGASAATGQIASQPLPNFNRKHGTRRAAPSPAARSRPPATEGLRPGPWPERFQHAAKHQVRNNPLVSSSYLE
jgi:hypothetical protein